jgi:hypothetical protein
MQSVSTDTAIAGGQPGSDLSLLDLLPLETVQEILNYIEHSVIYISRCVKSLECDGQPSQRQLRFHICPFSIGCDAFIPFGSDMFHLQEENFYLALARF